MNSPENVIVTKKCFLMSEIRLKHYNGRPHNSTQFKPPGRPTFFDKAKMLKFITVYIS